MVSSFWGDGYRSGGAYVLDVWKAHHGDVEAKDRLWVHRRAVAHQKTEDNLGIIPDPVVGDVLYFIDSSRPVVSAIGLKALPGASWHRPVVRQHTRIGEQAGEKTELASRGMSIERLTGEAVTYGGYVNVSRQNIDFSSPSALDVIVTDLAGQYAIETEKATVAALLDSAGGTVNYTAGDVESVAGAVWDAAAQAFTATAGQGRLVLAVSPDRLAEFGPLFAPVNPENAQGEGFAANSFGSGVMGSISGIQTIMSESLSGDEVLLFSTAAIEVFEQRVGTLQALDPSVAGMQVAYMGYFAPLVINGDAIVSISSGPPYTLSVEKDFTLDQGEEVTVQVFDPTGVDVTAESEFVVGGTAVEMTGNTVTAVAEGTSTVEVHHG